MCKWEVALTPSSASGSSAERRAGPRDSRRAPRARLRGMGAAFGARAHPAVAALFPPAFLRMGVTLGGGSKLAVRCALLAALLAAGAASLIPGACLTLGKGFRAARERLGQRGGWGIRRNPPRGWEGGKLEGGTSPPFFLGELGSPRAQGAGPDPAGTRAPPAASSAVGVARSLVCDWGAPLRFACRSRCVLGNPTLSRLPPVVSHTAVPSDALSWGRSSPARPRGQLFPAAPVDRSSVPPLLLWMCVAPLLGSPRPPPARPPGVSADDSTLTVKGLTSWH